MIGYWKLVHDDPFDSVISNLKGIVVVSDKDRVLRLHIFLKYDCKEKIEPQIRMGTSLDNYFNSSYC